MIGLILSYILIGLVAAKEEFDNSPYWRPEEENNVVVGLTFLLWPIKLMWGVLLLTLGTIYTVFQALRE